MRDELTTIFKTRTTAEWVVFGEQANTTLAPVNTPKTLADDPQFQARMPWLPASEHGIDMLPSPIKLLDETLPAPTKAPTLGQDTDAVLADVLGWDDERIAALRATGALG